MKRNGKPVARLLLFLVGVLLAADAPLVAQGTKPAIRTPWKRPAPTAPAPTPGPANKKAMVIVVEENEAQTYSGKRSDLFNAMEKVLDMGLGDLDINLPNVLEQAIRNIKGVRGEVLKAIRKGYRDMMSQLSAPAEVIGSATPQNCLTDMMKVLSQGFVTGPKPGKVFLDRYGEAATANCLRDMATPYYEKVVVLTDQKATFANFKQTLLELNQQGYRIDILLDVHGTGPANPQLNNNGCGSDCSAKLFFAKEGAASSRGDPIDADTLASINGNQPMNLNAVYMTSCWGSHFNKTWAKLGAKAVNGSTELNYYVLASPLLFMHYWTKERLPSHEAASKAYGRERRFFNGQKFTIKFHWRDPLTGKKHTVDEISIGVTWSKLMNRALALQYGANEKRPVDNDASSKRVVVGSPAVSL